MDCIKKLRELADECYTFNDCSDKLMAIADEIEREIAELESSYKSAIDEMHDNFMRAEKDLKRVIAERYMLLPVDSEGVPIHVGDMLEYEEYVTHKIKESRVVALEYRLSTEDWIVNCSQWTNPYETRRVKPRTIEDVLLDAIDEYERATMDDYDAVLRIAAKYADELRKMVVGE